MIKLLISGDLMSKSNSRIMTHRNGSPRLIKKQKALEYIDSSILQLKSQLRSHRTFTEPVYLHIIVYYSSKRPDLDISLIQDILEKVGVYKNDRLVYEIKAYKKFDKNNPRCEIEVDLIK